MKTTIADELFTLSGLLSPAECLTLIERGESIGFDPAAVRTAAGPRRLTEIRDNDRAEFHDAELAARLWGRCREFMPGAAGLDEHFRFYRYDVGQRFNRHRDGVVTRPGLRSRLTCLFYLNDEFDGGETLFYADDLIDGVRPAVAVVVPRTGETLCFRHNWWHEGRALSAGRKYVLRTDVLYQLDGAT